MDARKDLLERFVRYTKFDTMSDETRLPAKHPSTDGQWDLLRALRDELLAMGVKDTVLDENGFVVGNIPANGSDAASVAFMAHVDTSSACNGNNVHARVIGSYDGNDIVLGNNLVLKTAENPDLEKYRGTTLIVTDGTSLLGADDKAGVAVIMSNVRVLMENPSIKHGPVQVIFTPDEETGMGMDHFPTDRLKSRAVYTLDGSACYRIETECFNAATVNIDFTGVSAHLGAARGRMVNALTMASAFVSSLPQSESPEATDGRLGYYCPYSIEGSVESVRLKLMLRDFDFDGLQRRIDVLKTLSSTIGELYPGSRIDFSSSISYRNMQQANDADPVPLEMLMKAAGELEMPIQVGLIRGGTDGARLAERGIPCPNIFAGGYNFHSLNEWASLEAMHEAYRLVGQIIRCWAEK